MNINQRCVAFNGLQQFVSCTLNISIFFLPSLFCWYLFGTQNGTQQGHNVRIFNHPRSGVVYNFGRVCLSDCLSVCAADDNFRKP